MLQEGMTTEQQEGHNFEKPQVLEILWGTREFYGEHKNRGGNETTLEAIYLPSWSSKKGAGKESHKKANCDRAPSRCLSKQGCAGGLPTVLSIVLVHCQGLGPFSCSRPFPEPAPVACNCFLVFSSTPCSARRASGSGTRPEARFTR